MRHKGGKGGGGKRVERTEGSRKTWRKENTVKREREVLVEHKGGKERKRGKENFSGREKRERKELRGDGIGLPLLRGRERVCGRNRASTVYPGILEYLLSAFSL